jgi:hypothetical protein
MPDRRRDTFSGRRFTRERGCTSAAIWFGLRRRSWRNVATQLAFIEALMILVAIGYDFFLTNTPLKESDYDTGRALVAVQQLRRSWRLLLTSWCLLYVSLACSQGLALVRWPSLLRSGRRFR